MNGSLRVALMRNPFGEWDSKQGDHHLNLEIGMNEWEALVFEALDAPKWDQGGEVEDASEYLERQKRRFEQDLSAKGYEMLGRMWDVYRDAAYLPPEVRRLQEETLSVQRLTNNPDALEALSKLLIACKAASEVNSGIRLISD